MVQRVHFRHRNPYKTPGNLTIIEKTPSGKLVLNRRKKLGKVPVCGGCKAKLSGIVPARPAERSRSKKSDKTVNRPYGGTLCGDCVRSKLLRAFFKEEQGVIKNKQ